MNKMPEAMEHYWAMWNEFDLEANVREFRAERPAAGFIVASLLDSHNQRYRYEWNLVEDDKVTLRGFDVTTLDDEGLIERIDGFFGPLRPRRKQADG
jgi:hypothetical protein